MPYSCWQPLHLLQADQASAQDRNGCGLVGRSPHLPQLGQGLRQRPPAPAVDYDPVGSSAGMKKIQQQAVGFGATDVYPR